PRLKPVQGGIERSLFDQQLIFRGLLDPPREAVAMERPPAEALENQDAQRALGEVDRGAVGHRTACYAYDDRGVNDGAVIRRRAAALSAPTSGTGRTARPNRGASCDIQSLRSLRRRRRGTPEP